jgi:hypothetical protein
VLFRFCRQIVERCSERARKNHHQHEMDHDEQRDADHGGEVDAAGEWISTEQVGEPVKLHGLSDREAGHNLAANQGYHPNIKQPLHGIVMTQAVAKPAGYCGNHGADHRARSDRIEVATKVPAEEAVEQIGGSVC